MFEKISNQPTIPLNVGNLKLIQHHGHICKYFYTIKFLDYIIIYKPYFVEITKISNLMNENYLYYITK